MKKNKGAGGPFNSYEDRLEHMAKTLEVLSWRLEDVVALRDMVAEFRYLINCKSCGNPFFAKRSDATVCSFRCQARIRQNTKRHRKL